MGLRHSATSSFRKPLPNDRRPREASRYRYPISERPLPAIRRRYRSRPCVAGGSLPRRATSRLHLEDLDAGPPQFPWRHRLDLPAPRVASDDFAQHAGAPQRYGPCWISLLGNKAQTSPTVTGKMASVSSSVVIASTSSI